MKKLNILNIFLVVLFVTLLALYIDKIVSYKAWDRYYYGIDISNPEEFPIFLFEHEFTLTDGSKTSIDQSSLQKVSDLNSYWGSYNELNVNSPEFLPQKLYLSYTDIRSKKFYGDTITFPKGKMAELFKKAQKNKKLQKLNYTYHNMGLCIHLGVANEGNIVFWLIGNEWETELFRTQIRQKPFPKNLKVRYRPNFNDSTRDGILDTLFHIYLESLPIEKRSPKLEINANYIDSIPYFFRNFEK